MHSQGSFSKIQCVKKSVLEHLAFEGNVGVMAFYESYIKIFLYFEENIFLDTLFLVENSIYRDIQVISE